MGADKTVPQTVVPTEVQQTLTVTAEPTTVTQTVEPTQRAPTPAKSSAAAMSESASELFTMPDLMGENLQLAQDKLQARDSYLVDQQDAGGLGRVQVLDSKWKVCAQSRKAGKKVPIKTLVVYRQ